MPKALTLVDMVTAQVHRSGNLNSYHAQMNIFIVWLAFEPP